MSAADRMHAHAEQMRLRAALLRLGNEDATDHARELEARAERMDHLAGPPRPDEPTEDDYQ